MRSKGFGDIERVLNIITFRNCSWQLVVQLLMQLCPRPVSDILLHFASSFRTCSTIVLVGVCSA